MNILYKNFVFLLGGSCVPSLLPAFVVVFVSHKKKVHESFLSSQTRHAFLRLETKAHAGSTNMVPGKM